MNVARGQEELIRQRVWWLAARYSTVMHEFRATYRLCKKLRHGLAEMFDFCQQPLHRGVHSFTQRARTYACSITKIYKSPGRAAYWSCYKCVVKV